MDSAGRLVIPGKVRQAEGLKPGAPLEIQCRDDRIEIEPVSIELRFVRHGRFVVALAKRRPSEPLQAKPSRPRSKRFETNEGETLTSHAEFSSGYYVYGGLHLRLAPGP
jgi:AbrB family looped-hinge helix DNA binding protein